jgi:hypothetical protein
MVVVIGVTANVGNIKLMPTRPEAIPARLEPSPEAVGARA